MVKIFKTLSSYWRQRLRTIIIPSMICFIFLGITIPAHATSNISIADLDTLGGPSSLARAINDLGHVVGYSRTSSGATHAFMWTEQDGMIDLGSLGGDHSRAFGINNLGQVVGDSLTSTGERHAFLWTQQEGMIDLGTLGLSAIALDINDFGEVVGLGFLTSGAEHPFMWTEQDGMVDLGGITGDGSKAVAINNLSQLAGSTHLTSTGLRHAFRLTEGEGMVDLGTLGGPESDALDINDLGQVAGNSLVTSGAEIAIHAFIWSEQDGMVDLGTIDGDLSRAFGMNSLGQVVGDSSISAEDECLLGSDICHAFLWSRESGMIDLGTLGGDESTALDINNLGQVVGYSELPDGTQNLHATLWKVPVPTVAAVEEIENLGSQVQELNSTDQLNNGQATALSSTLNAAAHALNQDNTTAAINLLQAFINQVEAYLDAGILTADDAQLLIDDANNLIFALSG